MKVVAEFKIEYWQYLNKHSAVVAALPEFAEDPKQLIAMYRAMVLTRILDNKAINLQRMGKMGTYPAAIGQEAVGVGMVFGMHKDDILCPYYRDQAAMLARGVTASEILAYWSGDERGSDYTNKEICEDFPISIAVGTQPLHAAGAAYALKLRKQKRAVVGGCGEGGTSKGDFYEAMNFAGVEHLPVVFVVNNNQWAISVSREQQTAAQTIAQKAIAAGFPGIQVDGDDVIAVRAAVEHAMQNARDGKGPTLIEAVTYRLCDHTTADDASRYWNKDLVTEAWTNEPIGRLRQYMANQGIWSEPQEIELVKGCTAEIDQAVKAYLSMPPQPSTAMFDYLYETLPEELAEQRAMVAGGK